MPKSQKRVGLMVESLHGYGPRILDGIARWVHTHSGWRTTVFDGERSELAKLVAQWDGDGIICSITDQNFLRAAQSCQAPVVNIAGRFFDNFPDSVVSDDKACGQLAAQYYLDRGFKHFAFVGLHDSTFATERSDGFKDTLAHHGHPVTILKTPLGKEKTLAQSLQKLPLPTALFCPSDRRAASVLEACYQANLRVPEDIAVLGIGDHLQLCELCHPPLSSIDCNMELRGYEAAGLLSKLMSGDISPSQPIRILPTSVITRRSTDTFAFEDEDLIRALHFIHHNAHRPIKVNDVVAATSLSRRSLEQRFRSQFHQSIHDEIWRVHFELAKKLLSTTDLGLQAVAERSGFRSASALANLFKQNTGLTPRTYRAENRR
ncbi:MAG: DNA-binding transcriptional regulator [Verrucomicrobiota bacterium]